MRIALAHPQMDPADFNSALQVHALPPAYDFAADVHRAQQALPGSLDALEAFRRVLPALFLPCAADPSRDGLASMVRSQPESFDLTDNASDEQVRAVITAGLVADPDLSVQMLPAGEEPKAADGTRLFPPEYGETVDDYWIWTIRCKGFFPGPLWLLIRRDGNEQPYSYGFI